MTGDARTRAGSVLRRRWWWPVLGILLGISLGVAVLSVFRPHVYSGTVLQSPDPAPSMDGLSYANGAAVDVAALRGDIVLVYFGYTHCPDVCPLTLATVARALGDLGEDSSRVETLMVTVDPTRDTPDALAAYVARFSDDFRGVWGDETDTTTAAARYGVAYEYEEEDANGDYGVTHTSSLFLIDPDGALRIVYPFGITARELSADLEAMLG